MATTDAERQAIARLRYEIYVAELGDVHPDADHLSRTVWRSADDLPGSLHFYAGPVGRPVGALCVRVWGAGEAPAELRELYGFDGIPGADQVAGCETSFLAFRQGLRGSAAVSSLTSNSAHHAVEQFGCALVFARCSPGQLVAYRTLGLRPYAWALTNDSFGLQIPLVGATFDLGHLARMGSPWHHPMRSLDRTGELPPAGPPELLAFLAREETVVNDATAIEAALSAAVKRSPGSSLASLSTRTRRHLAKRALIVRVPPLAVVTQEGAVEREAYAVLEGLVGVRHGGKVETLGVGEIFGAYGLMSDTGRRATTATTGEASFLLVIRRSTLKRIDPDAARELAEELARVSVAAGTE